MKITSNHMRGLLIFPAGLSVILLQLAVIYQAPVGWIHTMVTLMWVWIAIFYHWPRIKVKYVDSTLNYETMMKYNKMVTDKINEVTDESLRRPYDG